MYMYMHTERILTVVFWTERIAQRLLLASASMVTVSTL